MSVADWIAIAAVSLPVAGVGLRMVVQMTRLVVAVESLSQSVQKFGDRLENHEIRLTRLEK